MRVKPRRALKAPGGEMGEAPVRPFTIGGMIYALWPRLSAVCCMLAVMVTPALAQQPPAGEMGRIHGRVINPTGLPQSGGTVSLSTDGGANLSYNFPVSSTGEYSGVAPEGEYTVLYRAPDTPEGKVADFIREVEVKAGQDTDQNVDMSRQEFIDRLTPEQQQQLRAMKEANASIPPASTAAGVDGDLAAVNQDFHDADNARETAAAKLGAAASAADIDYMSAEIENAKYGEIETLMTRDAAANPDEPVLWIALAQAELRQKNYLDAEINYKKALDIESKAAPPQPEIVGAADAGLGEVYARTLMVDEANAAFDAAAKADPAHAAMYLRNQAVIFFQEKNASAQVDAADEAIRIDPDEAILYYIKAEGLAVPAAIDAETNKILLPKECVAAYRKYLELSPNGPYAAAATSALQRAKEPDGTPGATPKN